MPWFRKKREEVKEVKEERPKEIEETKVNREFEDLKRKLSPEGFDEYVRKGKYKEYVKRLFSPHLKALRERLEGESDWLSNYNDKQIIELLNTAIRTYMERCHNKLVLCSDEKGKIFLSPTLYTWVKSMDAEMVELRRADGYGVPRSLEPEKEETIQTTELYIRIPKDVAEIGLALLNEELEKFEKEGIRCNYIISIPGKPEGRAYIKSEEVKVEK